MKSWLLVALSLTGAVPGSEAEAASTLSATPTAATYGPAAIPNGTDCTSCEGQWNCLTTTWQRCASGRWSEMMPCAAGTVCVPIGLSFDFHLVHDGEPPVPSPALSSCCTSSPTVNANLQTGSFSSGAGTSEATSQSRNGASMATMAGVGTVAVVFAGMLL